MAEETTNRRRPPTPSPYLFTVILFGFGLWFLRDGWFNSEIEHVMFNRIGAPILLGFAVWDGLRMRSRLKRAAQAAAELAGEAETP